MATTARCSWQASLPSPRNLIHIIEKPAHVRQHAAGEYEVDDELAIDKQHVQDGQELVPTVEAALLVHVDIFLLARRTIRYSWPDVFSVIDHYDR